MVANVLDDVSSAVLELDSRVYLTAVYRLTASPVLPTNFRPVVDDIRLELEDLEQAAGDLVDFRPVVDRVTLLGQQVEQLNRRAQAAHTSDEIAAANRQMKALSRVLIPTTYTLAGQFDQDPAWRLPFLPSLQPVRRLKALDPRSDEYHFVKTRLIRNVDAFSFALRQTLKAVGA